MQVAVLSDDFTRAVRAAAQATNTKASYPGAHGIHLQAAGGTLYVSGYDLDVRITVLAGAKVAEEGEVLVPVKLLTDYLRTLKGSQRLDLSLEDGKLRVLGERSQVVLNTLDLDDFPRFEEQGECIAEVDAGKLRRALECVTFAAARHYSRPVLTGVCIDVKDRAVTLAAADGFRLSVYTLPARDTVECRVVVPATDMAKLAKFLKVGTVWVYRSGSMVWFTVHEGSLEYMVRQVAGTFPDYARLIPEQWETSITGDTKAFLDTVKAANVFAQDDSGIIRLEVLDGKLYVSARAEGVGDYEQALDVQQEGKDGRIAFNGRYLTDVLSRLGDTFTLRIEGPELPGVFVTDEGFTHLVMPMFVQWAERQKTESAA